MSTRGQKKKNHLYTVSFLVPVAKRTETVSNAFFTDGVTLSDSAMLLGCVTHSVCAEGKAGSTVIMCIIPPCRIHCSLEQENIYPEQRNNNLIKGNLKWKYLRSSDRTG